MRNKVLLLGGLLAPVVYVTAVILGGLLRPGYDHLGQYVSELIAAGAPNKPLLDPLFALYNILTIGCAVGLFTAVRGARSDKGQTAGLLAAGILGAEGVFGLVTVFFPQDPVGATATATGSIHIVLAALSSLTSILAILLLGVGSVAHHACGASPATHSSR